MRKKKVSLFENKRKKKEYAIFYWKIWTYFY